MAALFEARMEPLVDSLRSKTADRLAKRGSGRNGSSKLRFYAALALTGIRPCESRPSRPLSTGIS